MDLNETEANTQCTIRDDEYIGEDGLRYCKKCNTRRQTEEKFLGKHRPIMCQCEVEAIRKEEEAIKRINKQRQLDRIRRASLLEGKYEKASFETTDLHSEEFVKIYTRCQNYCNVASVVLERGIGIYLFGTKGTGKSHLTACMANKLMNDMYTVLYTNFSEISKSIRATYNRTATETEQDLIRRLSEIDFLFIDDFGTEKVTKGDEDLWLQDKIYDIINLRYNKKKPIIFTANYSLRELIEDRGLMDKTVDRINEMTEVMRLTGPSYRQIIKKNREVLF